MPPTARKLAAGPCMEADRASGTVVDALCAAPLAQSAERLHGKEKVYGSIP